MPDDAIKVVPIWLTSFEGYDSSLCLRDIDGQNSAAGLAFFSLVMPDSSIASNEQCELKLSVRFASGERRSVVVKMKS